MMSPTPDQIREARIRAGLTQAQAGELVGSSPATAQVYWTSVERGICRMSAARWELFLIKTGTKEQNNG